MKYSIERIETGWRILAADGTEVAAFTGTEEAAYQDAVAHMGALITRSLAAETDAEKKADAVATTTGEGLLPERWEDVDGIAFQQALPGGRDFTECAWTWRDPTTSVLPLMLQTSNEGGHWGAELAGFIDQVSLDKDNTVHAGGRFYDNDAGNAARGLLLDGRKFGVSVDPSEAVSATLDGDLMDERIIFTAYEIAGLTMVPFPGFEQAAIKLAASMRIMFLREGPAIRLAAAKPAPGDEEDKQDKGSDEQAEGDKSTHDEVNYRNGEAGRSCGDCAHFVAGSPPHCQIVDDPIAAGGTCDKFVALAKNQNVSASVTAPTVPPRAWFELPEPKLGVEFLGDLRGNDVLVEQRQPVHDPDGRTVGFGDEVLGLACPFTITDDGQVYGHLTYWGQCHIGNPWGVGRCAAPVPSENEYDDFHASGYVRCDDGSELRTGLLHVGCEHSTAMNVRGVRDAAAHAGLAFAQVRVRDGEYGPWLSGCLLPTVTDEQVVKLRALTLSGEWAPELGAVIAVNDGGLPLQRVDRIAASSGAVFLVANRTIRAELKDQTQLKLVGGPIVSQCPECAKRAAERAAGNASFIPRELITRVDGVEAQLDLLIRLVSGIDSRTQHLRSPEAESIRAALEKRNHETDTA